MLTCEAPIQYGANVKMGVARCANNEALYAKIVEKTNELAAL